METSAILLSRQPLRPCGLTPWIRQTLNAVKWVKENHLCLFTSLGIQTWEFLIYSAQSHKIEQVVLIPAMNMHEFETLKEFIKVQFNLDPSLVRFKAIIPKTNAFQISQLFYERDSAAVFEADVLIPVSIRPKGHMEDLIQKKMNKKQGAVNVQFQIEYQKRRESISYHVSSENLPSETGMLGDQYIIHWTKAPNGPWPTEKKFAYFDAVAGSDFYPRNAFHTLQNIIKTGKIIASSVNMPKGTPVVSFSGLAPDKMLPLMRWRSRFRRMSFEPYGIGIEKMTARQLGIVPVRYYQKGEYPRNKPLWQLQSRGFKTDWKQEMEYRYLGDFNLPGISRTKIVCFCHTRHEADIIEKSSGLKAYPLIR
jgi:hypothetical protein